MLVGRGHCLLALGAIGLVTGGAACSPTDEPSHAQLAGRGAALTISVEQRATWVRNFNPFLVGTHRWPTIGPVYEPMLIYSTARAAYEPWLALSYVWEADQRTLRFTLRPGVTWSDGTPFTARDVAFTFGLMRRFPALDQNGVWGSLADVQATAPDQVTVSFARPFVPGLASVAQTPIVPEHIWSGIADPVAFNNPRPVATGAFTEVTVWQRQFFELGRNPHYWQPARFAVERLRFPALPSNEQAILALLRGEVDWSGNFIPDIERIYVRRDPARHGYWFPATGAMVFLYLNTQRPPFDDVRVRKAMSMAIDRPRIARIAMYGYTRPADASGLSDAYATWRDPELASAADAAWVQHDPDRANQLLDQAGFRRGADGRRRSPDGALLSYRLNVVSGWSDWVRVCQLIANDLRAVGITAVVTPYEFATWFDRLRTGEFELAIAWSSDGATPYRLYRDLMASATKKPLGEKSAVNWQRFASPAADRLLSAFEAAAEPAAQRAIMRKLQGVFASEAPAIPLFPGPAWGVYNARRWAGFPSGAQAFAVLSPNPRPDFQAEYMLVLAALTPAGRGRAP